MPTFMKNRALILDLDGTLIDSRADLTTAVNLARAEFNLGPLPLELVASYVGGGFRDLMARAWPEAGARLDEAAAVARRHYRAHLLDQTSLYPGAEETVRGLHADGYALGIVTNKPQEFTETILRAFGLEAYVALAIGGDSGLPLKPDPAPLLAVLERCGLRPSPDSWIVGDHVTDLAAGRRAGLSRCFCRYGFGTPREEGYELAVASLGEFAAHLKTRR